MSTSRSIAGVVTAHRQLEGGGFPVRRPFPTATLHLIDPFLLLDEMGPVDWPPGGAIGAPAHPHRGFETVTYVLEGRMEHADSKGHRGQLGAGDVQWMTAGKGVIHSELPDPQFKEKGGVMHGFQLWVNLPQDKKMMEPRYQDVPKAELPEARSEDGKVWVRVIAGESMGQSAVIDTVIPISYLHFEIKPGGRHAQVVPQEQAGFVYVFEGHGHFGEDAEPAEAGQVVLLERDGDQLRLAVPEDAQEPMQALVITGKPLREPVARYGPFVMNTEDEIRQAILDFQSGRLA
jgi:hypothetical protein